MQQETKAGKLKESVKLKRQEFIPYGNLYDAVKNMAESVPEGVKERLSTLDYVEIDAHSLKLILDAFESVDPVDISPKPRTKRNEVSDAD